MLILCGFESFPPFRRFQTLALEHMVSFTCGAGDIRWAMVALVLRSFTAAWMLAQKQFRG